MNEILLSSPHMSGHEEKYLKQAFKTNWIAPAGENIQLFEEKIKSYTQAERVVATNSGTSAIHLALKLLDIKQDDIVFCASATFIATVNPVLYEKAIPVFIDSEPITWNICPDALEKAFKFAKKYNCMPKLVIVVHLYGMPAKMKAIMEICNHYNVPVIEDAAESLGSLYNNVHTGTIGKYGIYSFNGNKIITTSGGGALIVNNDFEKKRANYLASQSKMESPFYEHQEAGYNYKLSNISASIGCGQMEVLQQRVIRKREINHLYKEHLQGIATFQTEEEKAFSNQWLTAIILENTDIGDLITRFKSKGIESRHIWNPMHRQPLFKNHLYFTKESNSSISDFIFNHGICLPSDTKMTDEQQMYVIEELKKILLIDVRPILREV